MKLQKTRQVLKSFLVNTKVKMNYPITSIANPWDSVIVFIHMDRLGEDEFESFGVRKMDTLLATVDIYNEPNIELKPDNIVISTDRDRQEIRTASPELNALIKEPKYAALQGIEGNAGAFTKTFDTDITKDELQQKSKIQRLHGLESYVLEVEKGKLNFTVCNLNGKVKENPATTHLDDTEDEDKMVVFSVDDVSMLPAMDYNVKVYKNNANGSQISIWRPTELPEVEVVITEKQ